MTQSAAYSNQRIFDELAVEWEHLKQAETRHRQSLANEVISVWQSELPKMETEFQQLVSGGDWQRGPRDVFTIVGLQRNEVRHSAMMAWLLDPLGRHGLGSALLEAILRDSFPKKRLVVDGTTTVACEVARGDTRADIIVWSQEFTLVIENKVDAVEGPRQCDRLYHHFRQEPNALFLFVTPKGRYPETATGDAADAFAALSLRRICVMLRNLADKKPGRDGVAEATVLNYLLTLEKEFL